MNAHIVVQVSDTHLAPQTPEYVSNWNAAVDCINASAPDLVVHTGDVAWNEPTNEAEQAFARAQLDALKAPWLAVPGNHDVGDAPPAPVFGQNVTLEGCARFRRAYGADRWLRELGDWALLGLNTLLFDSGRDDEQAQWDWLAESLRVRAGAPLAIFMHKPPFHDDFAEDKETSMSISAPARKRLRSIIVGSSVRLIASGHCHDYREYLGADGIKCVWSPSTAFILLQDMPTARQGIKMIGFVEHRFSGATHTHRMVVPSGATRLDNSLNNARRKELGLA